MGLLHLMDSNAQGTARNRYAFDLFGAPMEVAPLLVRGDVDIAVVPANLAATLYNQMDGGVLALAVVTLGVLHIVDTTGEVHSVADLAGRTVYATAQGSTTELALNYVLTQNGLTPGVDVDIVFRHEHAELAALLEMGEAEIALLPEPFVSTALARVDGLRLALDLTEEWDKVQPDYGLIMSVVVARRDFLEANPEAVAAFMEEYASSIGFISGNITQGARLAVNFGIIPDVAIAQAAIPRTHMVFIDGDTMKRNLMGFYRVLYDANPAVIGGEMPDAGFYFMP
jgi:NitT/TauT family transport system substrate-binding protein